ncbi:MAG: hypothetical protein QXJ75_01755 [Candidatus Bathyarchaeia archaeon]
MKIGEKEWNWCYLFNAKIDDVDCANCGYSRLFKASTKIESLPVI